MRAGGGRAGLLLVLLLGSATGLVGLRSGLPGPSRWRALPPALRGSPEFASRLTESWHRLYDAIRRAHESLAAEEPVTYVQGLVRVPPGWAFPPEPLVNSARSLMTQSENPDEKKTFIILARMRPWKLEFEPLYVQYGGAFVYPFGAFLGAAHLAGLARLTPDLSHYLTHPEDMGRLYLLGRIFILLFHLGTLWVLHELGRRLGGPRAGATAALLFAAAPFVITQTHMLKPHPVSGLWLALAALFMVRAVEDGRRAQYLACGACAGLAAGASLTLLFAAGMPLLAAVMRGRADLRRGAEGAAAAVGLAAAFNPYLLASPGRYAWELTVYSPTRWGLSPSGLLEMLRGLARGAGAGTALLIAAGTAMGALASDRRVRALAWTAAAGAALLWARFSYMGGEPLLRVFHAPFALACALAAALLARLPPKAAALVFALAVAESGARAATYLANLSIGSGPGSTRERAADWIDAQVPAGASLGLLRFPAPPDTPPFRWDRLDLRVFDKPEALGRRAPEWIVAPPAAWAAMDEAFRKRYDEAHAFPPAAPFGMAPTDDNFYANAGFLVLRRAR